MTLKSLNGLKLAPALCRNSKGQFFITSHMFTSNEDAATHCENMFVRWLIGTHYEISV